MRENPKHIAQWIKLAFEAGYDAARDGDPRPEGWANSTAKQIHDQLLVGDLTVKAHADAG